MSQTPSKPHQLCFFLYELALWLTLSFLVLISFHSRFEQHLNVNRIIDSSTIALSKKEMPFLKVGDRFPLYRFNPQMTSAIGDVTVASIDDKEIIATYDPTSFKYPMGRHGQVLDIQNSSLKVNVGSNLGFKKGQVLYVYYNRSIVGQIQLQDVFENESLANVFYLKGVYTPQQLTVSEYTVATQVVMVTNPWIPIIELLFILGMISLHVYYFFIRKKSIFYDCGVFLRQLGARYKFLTSSWLWNVLFGIPFLWFMVNFVPRCIDYIVDVLMFWSRNIIHTSFQIPNLTDFLNNNLASSYIAVAAIYLAVLIFKEKSPILVFWQAVGYKAKDNTLIKGYWRDALIWFLHLIIFYTFGNTLWGFLNGNMNAVFSTIWPNHHIAWYQISAWHQLPAAKNLTEKEIFTVIRFLLWSITIVGCMLGYGYSVFCYLWGKKIRNLDFTIMGWVTNAFCYGPLLGGVIGQMTPHTVGLDPIVTQGPLMTFNYIMEAFLNLLYTLTIWNMGTLFGVMTDKGVRSTGFYSVVRHPSYTLEALMFLMIYVNGFTTGVQWLAILNISIFTYFIRSEREDQFMASSNPQFVAYQSKTPYKFIPGVY